MEVKVETNMENELSQEGCMLRTWEGKMKTEKEEKNKYK
jgi:hypothetical protein